MADRETGIPNLFIVGAPRCGTTAWVHYLSSHPDIFFCSPKEPHHFNLDMPGYRWVRDRGDYLALFRNAGSARVVGEASVQYLYSKEAARAISAFNPQAKILIFIRDQEDFLPSLHNQTVYNGDEIIRDFESAWRLSGRRDPSNIGRFCRDTSVLNYKAAGRFDEQIARYHECFPAEQIRVFHYREWTASPRAAYAEILRLLELEDDGRTQFPRLNEAKTRRLNWLTPYLRQPPELLRVIRKALGLPAGLGTQLLQMNKRPGSTSFASETLKDEIREYYRHENARIEARIWRPEGGG